MHTYIHEEHGICHCSQPLCPRLLEQGGKLPRSPERKKLYYGRTAAEHTGGAAAVGAAAAGASSPAVGTNCTAASSKAASWLVRNFTADTNTKFDFGPGTAGKVSFSIENTANGYAFNCLQGDGATTGRLPNRAVVAGQVWYSCNVFCKGARDTPDENDPPLQTSFHFDAKTKELALKQSWACGSGSTL